MHASRSRRILVIEDEPLLVLVATNALMDAGFVVAGTAATAGQAVALAVDTHPDLVLMDIRLRGRGDGIDAALEIRRRANIPSLFTSGTIDSKAVERARPANPAGWLRKPYSRDKLVAALAHFFDKGTRR